MIPPIKEILRVLSITLASLTVLPKNGMSLDKFVLEYLLSETSKKTSSLLLTISSMFIVLLLLNVYVAPKNVKVT